MKYIVKLGKCAIKSYSLLRELVVFTDFKERREMICALANLLLENRSPLIEKSEKWLSIGADTIFIGMY